VTKAGLMMIEVNRRISRWDQSRIMSSVKFGPGPGKTQIVGGQRKSSTLPGIVPLAEDESHIGSAVTRTSGSVSVRSTALDGSLLPVSEQGWLRLA